MTKNLVHAVLVAVVAPLGIIACSANDTEPDETLVYTETVVDRDQLVCKRQKVAGSHIPRRVCRTRGQMERDREEALRATGPLRTMGGIGPPPAPPPSPTPR